MPSVEQVRALPLLLRRTVPASDGDLNGHMNIRAYIATHDAASWRWMDSLGMSEETFERDRRGLFDLEHHLHYVGEVLVGHEVAVHARLIARSETRMHGLFFLLDETAGRLANTFEWVAISMDLDARRPAPFADAVAAAIDAQIREHGALSWAPPLCGVISV